MRIRISIPGNLVQLVLNETGAKSVPDAVNKALENWSRRLRVDKIKSMAGKLHLDGDLNDLRELEIKKVNQSFLNEKAK
jgi:hypothetical protein